MARRRSQRALTSAVTLLLLAGLAFADWPQARHDGRRTAQATGTSDIVQPVAYWKRYVGGRLTAASLLLTDVDGDSADEVLMVAGGRVMAKRRDDAVVWQSDNLGLVAFVGADDLDGDGDEELLVRSSDRVHAFDPSVGALLWSLPAGELATIGAARLGDVDGDDLPDLVLQECVCCLVSGSEPGFALSFAAGVSAPARLWDFPTAHCNGGPAITLVDVNGTGPDEVLYGDLEQLVLMDGRNGAELARSPVLGTWVQQSRCVAADIDATGGEELVCVHDADEDPAVNQRRVFALRRQATTLELVWSRNLAPVVGGALSWVDLVNDLEGDGRPEVVISALVDGVWTTHIFAAATGTRRGTIPDEIATGVAPGPDGAVLLTSAIGHLSGWRLRSGPALEWTILDAQAPPSVDLSRTARSPIDRLATTADLDGDGRGDLLTALRSDPATVVGYHLASGDVNELGRHTLPAGSRLERTWPLSGTSDPDLALAVTSSNGILTLLGEGLAPVHDGSDDVSYAQLTTGGHYAPGWPRHNLSPRSARLGPGPERILLTDSRGALVALDAELGSFVAPPALRWEAPGASGATVVEGLDGEDPGVACLAIDQPETTPPTYSIVALDGDGGEIWRQPAPDTPFNDPLAGAFDDDGTPDLVFEWGDPGDVLVRTRAVSGVDGATLWDSNPVDPGSTRQPRGLAVARFDGDDLDDVYHQVGRTEVLSGADGSRLAANAAGSAYALPILSDLDGDDLPEVILHGSQKPLLVVDDDLAGIVYESTDNNRPLPYGAIADCGGGRQVLVQGSVENPAQLKLTDLSGGTAGQEITRVLIGGEIQEEEGAAGETFVGQLNATTVHQNLTGSGRPSAVVGSTDGWLYAVNPCDGGLDWSFPFGASVGEATFGDTDGDGRDEILVTVEDGYLYALRTFEIEAPADVVDSDPFTDATGDLQEIVTISSLEATWSAVPGAVGYQVALAGPDGNYIGEPWRDAGNRTTLLLEDLPLEDGKTYRFGVRAVTAEGRVSVDSVSNGIWVHLPVGAEDPPGDGCGCRASGRPAASSAALLLIVAALLRRRRRR